MNTSGAIPPDVRKAVVEFKNGYDKIRRSLMDELDSHQHPSTIYHYTNDVGLKGIWETGQLWLTVSLPCATAGRVEWYTWLILFASTRPFFSKHEAHKNEKEYRFLEAHPREPGVPSLKERPRRYMLFKYREFDWRRLAQGALKEIVVGPAAG